jgi:hypothetical protein
MSVTFSTSWYIFKAKFDSTVYQSWIHNMLSNVNNYNLVVYCDVASYHYIEPYLKNPRIMAIIKPVEKFSTYKYKQHWMKNHEQNNLLNQKVDWRVNMLWSEKLAFVKETMREQYFESDWYGWCDIGYFRGRPNDSSSSDLINWPSDKSMNELDHNKIYYACVNNNSQYVSQLFRMIQDKNSKDLPRFSIPDNQISIAGGFFLGTMENLEWWHDIFYGLLFKYFENKRLIKDDQILVADGVFSNIERFNLCYENDSKYDNWFLFQRFLL